MKLVLVSNHIMFIMFSIQNCVLEIKNVLQLVLVSSHIMFIIFSMKTCVFKWIKSEKLVLVSTDLIFIIFIIVKLCLEFIRQKVFKDPKVSQSYAELEGEKKNGEEKPMTDWRNCMKDQVTEGDTNHTEKSNVERYNQWGWCDDSDMDEYHSMAQDGYN